MSYISDLTLGLELAEERLPTIRCPHCQKFVRAYWYTEYGEPETDVICISKCPECKNNVAVAATVVITYHVDKVDDRYDPLRRRQYDEESARNEISKLLDELVENGSKFEVTRS